MADKPGFNIEPLFFSFSKTFVFLKLSVMARAHMTFGQVSLKAFVHFPKESFSKIKSCGGGNLGIPIQVKNYNFVRDHQSLGSMVFVVLRKASFSITHWTLCYKWSPLLVAILDFRSTRNMLILLLTISSLRPFFFSLGSIMSVL